MIGEETFSILYYTIFIGNSELAVNIKTSYDEFSNVRSKLYIYLTIRVILLLFEYPKTNYLVK